MDTKITRIIKRIINEEIDSSTVSTIFSNHPSDARPSDYDEVIASYKTEKGIEDTESNDEMLNQIAEHWHRRRVNNLLNEGKNSINKGTLVDTYKYYNNKGSDGTFNEIFAPEIKAGKEPFINFVNGCATKVSLALQAAGQKIDPGFKTTSGKQKGTTIQTSAEKLKNQLVAKWGNPEVLFKGSITEDELQKKFGINTGVLICAPCGFGSATGHATIWSKHLGKNKKGGTVDGTNYHIDNPDAKIYLWKVGE